jgi:NAD(P)-dependent dehydrogenase (short-subunit alcohol dehydrogenase family)
MLQDKICVVTGAGGGIGRACAVEMAAQGAAAVVALDVGDTAETVRLVEAAGAEALGLHCDVTDSAGVRAAMDAVGERWGRIDVLHNNAGVLELNLTEDTAVDTLPEDAWATVMAVNVTGTWLCTKHATPWLRRSPAAAIVNCASTSAYLAFETETAYCTSKAAILGLTRGTARDLAADGIRCNSYSPTSTRTGMIEKEFAGDPAAAEAMLSSTHLIRRLGRPDDVAKLVCFLASDDAGFITGASYPVDGGAMAWRGVHAVEATA